MHIEEACGIYNEMPVIIIANDLPHEIQAKCSQSNSQLEWPRRWY